MKYESIKQAAILLALDNNGINRYRGVIDFITDLEAFLDKWPIEYLDKVNRWLSDIGETQLEVFVTGEYDDVQAITAGGPRAVDDFFNRIFEEVV